MDPKALLQERTELFDNAFHFRHNKRVPLGCNLWSWMVLDCGYKQSEALQSYDRMEQIIREIHERYQFDAYHNLLVRNPIHLTNQLGGGCSWFDPTDEFIQCADINYMAKDEYAEYMENPNRFFWSKALPRYTKWNDKDFTLTLGGLKKAMEEYDRFLGYCRRIVDINRDDYGALMYYTSTVTPALDDFLVCLRGIKGLSIDLRKNKEQLLEALDRHWERRYVPVLKSAMEVGKKPGYISAISCALLGHSILSPKQFGEFYWRHLKQMIDAAIEHNQQIYLFAEASILHFAEYFEEVPKGVLMIHLEQDDIFEFRKRLPNIAVAGGMPAALLGHGTKEECVDYAKKLIDELGDGFVLCQNKMIAYRSDCTRENLMAVCDFARNYTL